MAWIGWAAVMGAGADSPAEKAKAWAREMIPQTQLHGRVVCLAEEMTQRHGADLDLPALRAPRDVDDFDRVAVLRARVHRPAVGAEYRVLRIVALHFHREHLAPGGGVDEGDAVRLLAKCSIPLQLPKGWPIGRPRSRAERSGW